MLLLPVRNRIPDGIIKAEFAFPDLVKQRWLALIIKGRVAAQQDEEHHASAPQIYSRTVDQARRALHTHLHISRLYSHQDCHVNTSFLDLPSPQLLHVLRKYFLCYAILCCAMLCHAVLCHAVLGYAALCWAMLRCAVLQECGAARVRKTA